MAYLEWKSEFSVGVAYIDKQHRKLFSLINEYYKSFRKDSSDNHLFDFLKALDDYAFVHFTSEERNMSLFQFEGYVDHKKEHDQFREFIESKMYDIKSGKKVFGMEVTNFIKDWLTRHVLGTDIKYTEVFRKNGLS